MLSVNFTPFPNLQSERLVFREISKKDSNAFFRMRNNSSIMKYIPRPIMTLESEATELIEIILERINANEAINWAICLNNNSEMIGIISFHIIKKEHYRAEIGYIISEVFQNKGYASEAIEAILNFGFNTMKLHSVEAIINPKNIASQRVLEKNNFKKEAHFIEHECQNGEFYDSAVYSILAKNFKF